MKKEAFEAYLGEADLASSTVYSRIWALSTIEKRQELDLDVEYEKDGLQGVMTLLSYTTEDAAAGRANPTNITIDPANLLGRLRWFRSHLRSYIQFRGGPLVPTPEPEIEEAVVEAVEITFGLEKDMQLALRQNIAQLEPGLKVIDGGTERKVDSGFIDILARDADGTLVVIEIKSIASKPDSVAQVLGYMGAIAEEENAQDVRGYLIAADHPKRVRWAAKAVPNLKLRTYRFTFEFEPA